MYDRLVVLLTFIMMPSLLMAQKNVYPYFFSDDIRDLKIEVNQYIQFKEYPLEFLYTYMGNYKKAVQELSNGKKEQNQYKGWDSEKINKYETLNAHDWILQQAVNNKIIIINEAHHLPAHRLFTLSLLKDLQKLGYRYLSIEGVKRKKTDSLNSRGYPVLTDLDYFDPQFGNLIREGLALNYTILGHDTADYSVRTDPTLFAQRRDSLGAVNIKKIFDADQQAKIIVHCGYSHGDECLNPQVGKRLALQIKELTGIDPYTINQTGFMENDLETPHPLLQLKKPVQAVAIRPKMDNDKLPCADIQIGHPLTRFTNGRPQWLLLKNQRFFSPAPYLQKGRNYLIQAYPQNEKIENGVPVDVIEVNGDPNEFSLVLHPGAYQLVIREKEGKEKRVQIYVKK